MADWKESKIKDAPFEVIDGDRGANYSSQNEFYSNDHCLFLSAKNVKKTAFDFSERQFISEEKDTFLRKGRLKRNDTVLTTRGTVGNLAFYSNEVPFENIRINSGMVIIRPYENELKPKFCFYLLGRYSKTILKFLEALAQARKTRKGSPAGLPFPYCNY